MAKNQGDDDITAAQALLDAVLHEDTDGAEIIDVDDDGMVHIQSSSFVMSVLQTAFRSLDTLRKGIYYAVKSIIPTGENKMLDDIPEGDVIPVTLDDDADDGELKDEVISVNLDDDVEEDPLVRYVHELDTESMLKEARDGIAKKALEKILTAGAMKELGLDHLEPVADSHLLYSTTTTSNSNVGVLMAQGRAEALGQVVSHTNHVVSIIRGEKDPIADLEEIDSLGEASSFPLGGNVLAVKVDGKSVTTTFNFAAYLQLLNSQLDSDSALKSPILAQLIGADEETYTMHLGTFKKLMGEAADVIFNPEEGGLRPVMTGGISDKHDISSDLLEQKSLFAVALDKSGSMDGTRLDVCKSKMIEALRALTDSAENWTVILTSFSDDATTEEFDSNEHSIENIEKYINSIYADGYTRLNLTSKEMYASLTGKADGYSHVTTIIFTDGDDGGTDTCDESEIIESAELARSTMSNLRIVTAEIGGRNSKFFSNFAKQIGADHIDLDKMEGLGVIADMAEDLNTSSSVIKFLAAGYEKYVRMVGTHGKVTVSKDVLSAQTTEITINGDEYIVQEPTMSLMGDETFVDGYDNNNDNSNI